MTLRTIPIHRVGNRHNLFMGCDRELVMLSALLSAILIFAAQDCLAVFFGITLWSASLWVLRIMGKADPLLRFIYLRQRRYQAYYPPRSRPFRLNTKTQESQYK